MVLAIVLDALVGDPDWLYARVPHPIVLLGRLTAALERRLLRLEDEARWQRLAGVGLLALVVGTATGIGALVTLLAASFANGWVLEAVAIAVLLAWRSLADHVRAVAVALRQGPGPARLAVARIVGRDPERLDEPAIGRAAVESLAENLSDGVTAPLFWAAIGGLPGIAAYKAVNTLDSMVGHKNERYLHFGWASARLDDVLNFLPARLTGIAILVVARLWPGLDAEGAWRALGRDAPRHRSPNAGWPEAAMAGALGLRLAGPRAYHGVVVDDGWMGDGRAEVGPDDIERAIHVAAAAYALFALVAAGLLWLRSSG